MTIRICSYNVEWFDDLFETDNSLKTTTDATPRLQAIRDVLGVIDADIVGILEAPNTTTTTGNQDAVAKLNNFLASFPGLRTTNALAGFISAGRQELVCLFDPNVVTMAHNPGGGGVTNPRFDGELRVDTDNDRISEHYKMYRPPLETDVTVTASDNTFKLMLAHTKSKGIFNSMDYIHWQRENERNRRKLFAEATWIRKRVDEWLSGGHDVVVMGDINDGPGMDFYEFQFARSAVEIIMGDLFSPDAVLRNHAGRPKWKRYGWEPSSARFKDRFTEDYVNVLIDHILVSQGLTVETHKVWNPYQDDGARPHRTTLLAASDHFPVTVDLNV
jgi:predicted extracellular nuclease